MPGALPEGAAPGLEVGKGRPFVISSFINILTLRLLIIYTSLNIIIIIISLLSSIL